jgi:hypothetical protein
MLPAAQHSLTAVEAVKRARTIWPEVTLSVDFESETLPLLFASDADFAGYYAAMEAVHHRKGRFIRQVRAHNEAAREHRAKADWGACLEALEQGCSARRHVFAKDDYQCIAADVHLAWCAIHAATIVAVQHDEEHLAAAHSLFALARGHVHRLSLLHRMTEHADDSGSTAHDRECWRWLQSRMALVLNNNWANYWAARKRWGACNQHATIASRMANKLIPHVAVALLPDVEVKKSDLARLAAASASPITPASDDSPSEPKSPAGDGPQDNSAPEDVIRVPAPPAALFAGMAAESWENPAPLVLLLEVRRLVCEAIQRSTGTAALAQRDGAEILRRLHSITLLTNAAQVDDAFEGHATIAPPTTNINESSLGASGNHKSSEAGSLGVWAMLATEPSVTAITLSTHDTHTRSPFASLRMTTKYTSCVATAFVHLHLRDIKGARTSTHDAIAMLSQLPALANVEEAPFFVKRTHDLARCIEAAAKVSLVAQRTMSRDATRQAEGLRAAKLVRDDLLARRGAAEREKRQAQWMQWAVTNDDSGALEDELTDEQRHALFQLPEGAVEKRRLDRIIESRAQTPGVTGLDALSVTIEPPIPRAVSALGAARAGTELAPLVRLSDAAKQVLRAERLSTPAKPYGHMPLLGPAEQQTTADEAVPAPSSMEVDGPEADAAATRRREVRHRQRQLRAMLPALNVHSAAYREVVRELAAYEAEMRQVRDVAARRGLLERADQIASRAGMSETWKKSRMRAFSSFASFSSERSGHR